MLDRLASAAPAERKELQQFSGIKYDPDGAMFDENVKSRLQLPMCEYPDWMHGWVASGGIAQFHINQFVLKLIEHVDGLSLEAIDTWCNEVKLPRSFTQPRRTFFRDRIVADHKSSIKAFASEV